jgi:hypothetical protein
VVIKQFLRLSSCLQSPLNWNVSGFPVCDRSSYPSVSLYGGAVVSLQDKDFLPNIDDDADMDEMLNDNDFIEDGVYAVHKKHDLLSELEHMRKLQEERSHSGMKDKSMLLVQQSSVGDVCVQVSA